MSLAVIDASVLVVFYAADDPRHSLVADRLKLGDALFAPAHLDAEIVSALRGMTRSNRGLDQVVPKRFCALGGFPGPTDATASVAGPYVGTASQHHGL